jgi:hypothetical protein
MLRELEYKGRVVLLTVLPEQGRWAYRIDDGPIRMLREAREARARELLYAEAEAAARREIDRADRSGAEGEPRCR